MKRFGFTLAEVLITLGVIGVVAAITMPLIIQEHKKTQTISQFKKAYSELSQAFLKASQDVDVYALGNNWSKLDEVMETMAKYYDPVIKYSTEFTKYGYDSFCIDPNHRKGFPKAHPNIGYRFLNQNTYVNGMTTPVTGSPSFVLKDGSCVGFGNYASQRLIIVDLNGNVNGPNRSGYDLFLFRLNEQGKVIPWDRGWRPFDNHIKQSCNKNTYQAGEYCSSKIIRDGYKINYW